MERFNFNKEQNSAEDFTKNKSRLVEDSSEMERKEKIEDIQNKEREFLGRIKEYARNAFHSIYREYEKNFKKTLRAVTLATILSIPIGEKAFAEREEKLSKESTVAMVQIDKEAIKEDVEMQKSIIEQKELIKEKYDQKIFIGEGFSLEELQDFKDALEEIKTFSPDKFNELKIILVKADTDLFSMKAILNFCEKFDTIKDIELKRDLDKKSDNIGFIKELLRLEEEINAQDKTNIDNYDLIICNHKKKIKKDLIKRDRFMDWYTVRVSGGVASIQEKDSYKNTYIHELSHLITLNDKSIYKELADKFKEINKKTDGHIMTVFIESMNVCIKRYPGFVSVFAGEGGQGGIIPRYPYEYKYNERNNTYEDTAETLTYMINDYHYADDDPIVQEKIEAIKNFLNEKTND